MPSLWTLYTEGSGLSQVQCGTQLFHSAGNLPNIHPGTFSSKNLGSVLIVSQSFNKLFSSTEINWVPDGNEMENREMLSSLKYTIYYVMSCVLLMRFFCHVILERVGFFLHMVLLPPTPPTPVLQGACST